MKHGEELSAEAPEATKRVAEIDDQEGLGKLVMERYDPGWEARLAHWWSEIKHNLFVRVRFIIYLLFWIILALILKFCK